MRASWSLLKRWSSLASWRRRRRYPTAAAELKPGDENTMYNAFGRRQPGGSADMTGKTQFFRINKVSRATFATREAAMALPATITVVAQMSLCRPQS